MKPFQENGLGIQPMPSIKDYFICLEENYAFVRTEKPANCISDIATGAVVYIIKIWLPFGKL